MFCAAFRGWRFGGPGKIVLLGSGRSSLNLPVWRSRNLEKWKPLNLGRGPGTSCPWRIVIRVCPESPFVKQFSSEGEDRSSIGETTQKQEEPIFLGLKDSNSKSVCSLQPFVPSCFCILGLGAHGASQGPSSPMNLTFSRRTVSTPCVSTLAVLILCCPRCQRLIVSPGGFPNQCILSSFVGSMTTSVEPYSLRMGTHIFDSGSLA